VSAVCFADPDMPTSQLNAELEAIDISIEKFEEDDFQEKVFDGEIISKTNKIE
jgi:hypothetical protein